MKTKYILERDGKHLAAVFVDDKEVDELKLKITELMNKAKVIYGDVTGLTQIEFLSLYTNPKYKELNVDFFKPDGLSEDEIMVRLSIMSEEFKKYGIISDL